MSQVVFFLRKITAHLLDERFSSVREAKGLASKSDGVVAFRVERTELYVSQTKEVHHSMHCLSLGSTANEVHSRLKLNTLSRETLQASTNLMTLLKDGHIVSISLKNKATSEAAKS